MWRYLKKEFTLSYHLKKNISDGGKKIWVFEKCCFE